MTRFLLVLLLAGCHENVQLASLALDENVRSAVMFGVDGDAVQWVEARNLEPDFGAIAFEGSPDLVALTYGCSVERLGLKPGRIPLLSEPEFDARLPASLHTVGASLDEGEWQEAVLAEPVERALRRIELPPDNVCEATRARYFPRDLFVPADGHSDAAFVEPLDDTTVLVGSNDGKVYRVTLDGEIERRPELEDRVYLGAHRMPDGELFLLARNGTLIRGRLGDAFTVVTSTAPFDRPERIAMVGPTTPGAELELFAATTERRFARFDGQRWTLIASVEHGGIYLPAAAWIEPGHGAAIGLGEKNGSVLRWFRGSVTDEPLPTESGVASIMQHPTLGTVVGMDDGSMYQRTPGGWMPFLGGPDVMYVRTIAPLSSGFLFGASTERNFLGYEYGQYFPGAGYCRLEDLTELAASHIAQVGESTFMLATLQFFDNPFGLTVLDQVDPPGACSGGVD